jgi:hypothetical protein
MERTVVEVPLPDQILLLEREVGGAQQLAAEITGPLVTRDAFDRTCQVAPADTDAISAERDHVPSLFRRPWGPDRDVHIASRSATLREGHRDR